MLMTYADYEALKGPDVSVAEALAMPADGDFDFEFPRLSLTLREVDFD